MQREKQTSMNSSKRRYRVTAAAEGRIPAQNASWIRFTVLPRRWSPGNDAQLQPSALRSSRFSDGLDRSLTVYCLLCRTKKQWPLLKHSSDLENARLTLSILVHAATVEAFVTLIKGIQDLVHPYCIFLPFYHYRYSLHFLYLSRP